MVCLRADNSYQWVGRLEVDYTVVADLNCNFVVLDCLDVIGNYGRTC